MKNENKTIRLELELTNTCNLACPLCIRQTHPVEIGKDIRDYYTIINQLNSFKDLKYVTIAGPTSEPTLHPDLFRIIKYLIDRDIEISLFINGDTYNDNYYRRLGLLFNKSKQGSHIYLTVCGSTQELHEKYRVGSDLETVLHRLSIINIFSKKGILNYIVFNYNESDSKAKNKIFSNFTIEYFNTLPVAEHYQLESDIHLIDKLADVYNSIDRDAEDIICPADTYGFKLISSDGSINPCSLYKMYGTQHCFECSKKNTQMLKNNKIYRLCEPEDETSELELHIKE